MTRTKLDLLMTNVINVGLFVGIFAFGCWRWHLLQDVIIESADSQEQYKTIHGALKSTSQLDHLGESVHEWTPSDSTEYQKKLSLALDRIDSLGDFYTRAKIDSVKTALSLKGYLMTEMYSTIQKRNANDEHLREDKKVTVKDTETYVKHYTGHVFRSSREEVTSKSKNRTVTVPSINEVAFIDKELCDINLSILNDSLVNVNKWLDVNMSQILDEDDDKAEKKASQMLEKASNIGQTTFMGGMTFLLVVFLLNFGNSWRRAKVMKQLEDESEKNRQLVENRRKMMYAIVHDLRTPLSIIIGYNDWEKQTPTKSEKYISAISFSANQLRNMIDQLLAYFRLESNRETLKPRDFSLVELSNELTNAFELRASENEIKFEKSELQNVVLNGDFDKISHIAMNLLDNAFKFTKEGSVSLGIAYLDGSLNITVSDTGIGIKEADRLRVFTPFTRFSNAVATGKDGFGIGLSTAKMLVDLMDGSITYSSTDEGTTFVVRLPLKVAKRMEEPVAETVVKASSEKKRLLIVDDSKTWLLMMQGILQQNGFDCDICSDSSKVFDMLRETKYSLVMLDLQMPGKSGLEILRLMRKSKVGNSQTVPVVVSTASAEDVREDLMAAGFDEYIPKMAQTETMVKLINEVIAKKTNAVSPDFTQLRKSVAQYLIEETREAVNGLHKAVEKMDFDGMNGWAHSLKSSWVLYRIGVLVDPVMEIAKKKDANAAKRLGEYMTEIDKMAEIVIREAQKKLDTEDEQGNRC